MILGSKEQFISGCFRCKQRNYTTKYGNHYYCSTCRIKVKMENEQERRKKHGKTVC